MTNLDECYKVLELEPGASPEEIHQGYKDLAMVWHPDRFPNHPRLQQKAHKKLQEINEAHQQLRSYQPTSVAVTTPSNSQSEQRQTSYSNSNDFYKEATNKAKTENYSRDCEEYIRLKNLNRKDIYVWLD